MSTTTSSEAFLTHNWGKEISPGIYDNHERVKEVNRRLTSKGLITWFDSKKLEGTNVKTQLTDGIDETKVLLVFITKEYQTKVNSDDSNDFCYYEFNYAALRLSANRMLAIVLDKDMKNPKEWKGRLAAELGYHLFTDLTVAFERYEQSPSDDSLLELKCQEIYDKVKGIIANQSIPIRNSDTKMIELLNLPSQYTWIKPFFENEISTMHYGSVRQRIVAASSKLTEYPFLNNYFQTLQYREIFLRILKRKDANLLLVNNVQQDTRVSIFVGFLLLLLEAQGCLVIDILSVLIQLLMETIPDPNAFDKATFLQILINAEIISILHSLLQEKDTKIMINERERFRYLINISILSGLLLNEKNASLLLQLALFERSSGNEHTLQFRKEFLLSFYEPIIRIGENNPQMWKGLEKVELHFLLQGMINNSTDTVIVQNGCKAVEILGKDEVNQENLAILNISQILLNLLLYYQENPSPEILVHILKAMTAVASHDQISKEMRSTEYLHALITTFLGYEGKLDNIVILALNDLQSVLKISPQLDFDSSQFNEEEKNALVQCAVFLLFESEPTKLGPSVHKFYDVHTQVTEKKDNFISMITDFQVDQILIYLIKRAESTLRSEVATNLQERELFNLILLVYALILEFSKSERIFPFFSSTDINLVCQLANGDICFNYEVLHSILAHMTDRISPDTAIIEQSIVEKWKGLSFEQLSFLLKGTSLYYTRPELCVVAAKGFQIIATDPSNATKLKELGADKDLIRYLEYYKQGSEDSSFETVIQLLKSLNVLLKENEINNNLMKSDETVSLLLDILLFHFSEEDQVLNQTMRKLMGTASIIDIHQTKTVLDHAILDYLQLCDMLLKVATKFNNDQLLKVLKLIFMKYVSHPEVSLQVINFFSYLLFETELLSLDDLSDHGVLQGFVKLLEEPATTEFLQKKLKILNALTLSFENNIKLSKLGIINVLFEIASSQIQEGMVVQAAEEQVLIDIFGIVNRFSHNEDWIGRYFAKERIIEILCSLVKTVKSMFRNFAVDLLNKILDESVITPVSSPSAAAGCCIGNDYLEKAASLMYGQEIKTVPINYYKIMEKLLSAESNAERLREISSNLFNQPSNICLFLPDSTIIFAMRTMNRIIQRTESLKPIWLALNFPESIIRALSFHYLKVDFTFALLTLMKAFISSNTEGAVQFWKNGIILYLMMIFTNSSSDSTSIELLSLEIIVILLNYEFSDVRSVLKQKKHLKQFIIMWNKYHDTNTSSASSIIILLKEILKRITSLPSEGNENKIDANLLKQFKQLGFPNKHFQELSINPFLTTLPEEIYPILKSFLLYDDYLCLVNSSKKDFYEIKRKTIYMKLTKKYSMMFLRNENNFQHQIKALVADPSQQISIQLTDDALQITNLIDLAVHRVDYVSNENCFPHLPLVKEKHFRSSLKRISDISSLSHLQSVSLSFCNNLIDISTLRDVAVVYLSRCKNVRDFSVLGKQRKLTIDCCEQLSDVSSFSNIIELTLCGCPLLEDISPLKNIPYLSIRSCKFFRDLSPLLGNHERLEIRWCNYELVGYEILWNIPIVTLWHCNISNVEVLRNAKSVSLYDCNDLIDVSPLVNVKKIHIDSCKKIVDINVLANVPEIALANLPSVRNVDALKRKNQNLTIYGKVVLLAASTRRIVIKPETLGALNLIPLLTYLYCLEISFVQIDFSTEGLAHIPVISFKICARLTNIDGLGGNREVCIIDCPLIRDVSSLRKIPVISIQDCSGLTNIDGLGSNREVCIINCPLIRDVSSLRNVPLVTIKRCKGIHDYSCLSNVPRLKIIWD